MVRTVAGAVSESAWSNVRQRLDYQVPEASPPDGVRRLLAWRGAKPVARIALGVVDDLVGAPGRTGWVGWYEAFDRAAGVPILLEARTALGAESVDRIIGPFHGSTWDRYRLAIRRRGKEPPPFLSEPWNPPGYARHFTDAGFSVIAEYESRSVPPRADDAARAVRTRSGLAERGVRVRQLDLARFDDELRRLFELSLVAFVENPFYSPLGWDRFRSMYHSLGPLLDPALVFLAESEAGELLGYCFSFPDPLAATGPERIILKTLAVAPAARGLGLGGALTTLTQGAAADRRATVIHALMAAGNLSRRISTGAGGELFRRYSLFQAVGL